jgi:C4-dicarboxylate transporter, DctM subunit
MSAELVGSLGVLCLIILILFLRMWIGMAMILVGSIGIFILQSSKSTFGIMGTVPYETSAYYPMTAIPLFILMGVIVGNTNIGENLYFSVHKWVGAMRGGLASATVLACAVFAAITGSSGTGTILMSKVAMPQMQKFKYDDKLSSGAIISAGTLGILIPPSMGLIIYGLLTEQSVGKLFIAGLIPGILLTLLFMAAVFVVTTINPKAGPAGPKTLFKEKIISLRKTWHVLLLFLLVLGGIYRGFFTPTEAGAIGAFGAFIIAAATRQLNMQKLAEILKETVATGSMIFLIIIGAFVFMKFLGLSKLPFALVEIINGLEVSKYIVFFGIVVVYILLGMFLEVYSTVTLTIPIVFPIITALGFDPIWFGVIIVLVIEMGLITPPVGINAFIFSGITQVPLATAFRGVIPFFLAMVFCVILLTIFPEIALFLTRTM